MLSDALHILQSHAQHLRAQGVVHAAVFGSTARDGAGNDVDVLIDLDETRSLNVFDYAAIKEEIGNLLGGRVDVVTREGLKKTLKAQVEREAVNAF